MDTILINRKHFIRVFFIVFNLNVVYVGAERRTSLDQFHAMIPQNMIYSADQIRLSNTIGQGTLGFMLIEQ